MHINHSYAYNIIHTLCLLWVPLFTTQIPSCTLDYVGMRSSKFKQKTQQPFLLLPLPWNIAHGVGPQIINDTLLCIWWEILSN